MKLKICLFCFWLLLSCAFLAFWEAGKVSNHTPPIEQTKTAKVPYEKTPELGVVAGYDPKVLKNDLYDSKFDYVTMGGHDEVDIHTDRKTGITTVKLGGVDITALERRIEALEVKLRKAELEKR